MESVFTCLWLHVYPGLPTYFYQGGESALDRCLIPDSYVAAAKLHPKVYTIPSHIVNGHEILKMKLNVRPTVLSNPRHPKHLTIPSGVFIPGKDGTPVKSTSALQELVRLLHREHDRLYPKRQASALGVKIVTSLKAVLLTRLTTLVCLTIFLLLTSTSVPDYLGSYLTIASCFWTWWRAQPIPKLHPDIRPYVRARKYVRDNAQCVNVPMAIIEDLILASRKAILPDTNSLLVTNGCYSIPTLLIHQVLEVVETCIEGIPFVSNDEANIQARGLGNMVAFSERMRSICSKVNIIMDLFLQKRGINAPLTRIWI